MEGAPPLLQQAAIGNLVGEHVLEGVFQLGKETRFLEELTALQVPEPSPQLRFWSPASPLCADGEVLSRPVPAPQRTPD
jgi:hypothetical protein